MGQYLPVLVMLVLGAGFAGSSLVMSKAVSPKRPSAAKAAPYECGIVPGQQPPERFPDDGKARTQSHNRTEIMVI